MPSCWRARSTAAAESNMRFALFRVFAHVDKLLVDCQSNRRRNERRRSLRCDHRQRNVRRDFAERQCGKIARKLSSLHRSTVRCTILAQRVVFCHRILQFHNVSFCSIKHNIFASYFLVRSSQLLSPANVFIFTSSCRPTTSSLLEENAGHQ